MDAVAQMANMDPAAMQAQMAQAQAMMSNMSPDAMRQQVQTAGEQIKNLSPDELAAQTAAAQLSCGSAIAQQCSAKTGRPRWRRGDMRGPKLWLLRRRCVVSPRSRPDVPCHRRRPQFQILVLISLPSAWRGMAPVLKTWTFRLSKRLRLRHVSWMK